MYEISSVKSAKQSTTSCLLIKEFKEKRKPFLVVDCDALIVSARPCCARIPHTMSRTSLVMHQSERQLVKLTTQ